MDLISRVTQLGGAATFAVLVAHCGRRAVRRGIRDGTLVRIARGRYSLPSANTSVRAAVQYGGVVSMRSAAQRHGWGLRRIPDLPDVTFPRTRHVERAARKVLVPHWSDIDPADVHAGVTTKRRTLVDCMRNLPLEDAVPIVDSAMRAGDVTRSELMMIASSMRGRGRARAMAVAAMATAAAANPYESTLRAIAATIPGLSVRAQQPIEIGGHRTRHPDLFDENLGIVIEAESFAWHGESASLTRDCVRYNAFTILGLIVVRFSWSQVMFEPAYVIEALVGAVSLARRHANVVDGRIDRTGRPSSNIRMPHRP